MEYVVPNFNVGDVIVEYNIALGELVDIKVFMQKSNNRVEITDVLPTSALFEIKQDLMGTDKVRNLLEESLL